MIHALLLVTVVMHRIRGRKAGLQSGAAAWYNGAGPATCATISAARDSRRDYQIRRAERTIPTMPTCSLIDEGLPARHAGWKSALRPSAPRRVATQTFSRSLPIRRSGHSDPVRQPPVRDGARSGRGLASLRFDRLPQVSRRSGSGDGPSPTAEGRRSDPISRRICTRTGASRRRHGGDFITGGAPPTARMPSFTISSRTIF